MSIDFPQDADSIEIKSKTQIKQELAELRDFGEQLAALPKGVYQTLNIPPKLDEAFQTLGRIKSFVARKRQLQYIAKVLREMDVEPLKAALDDVEKGRKQLARSHQKLESLRDRLMENDKTALEAVIESHPGCNIQQLRQLIRTAQKEKQANKTNTARSRLLSFLKAL